MLTPVQIQTVYGFNLVVSPSNKPLGYGVKIAVVSAYHYSNLQSDLNNYCKKYSLQPITLNIINQAGSVSNSNIALEICATVQMINVISPGAVLYVIESKSTSLVDLQTAVRTAINLGVSVITLPFGSAEFSNEMSLEPLFENNGGNITFIAAAGNTAGVPTYPSTSQHVIAVGGTTLHLNPNNTRLSESVWTQSGGLSQFIQRPSYQDITNSDGFRNTPDVSLVADPSTGVAVYCSILGGYLSQGGTVISSSIFSATIAIANQLRKSLSKPMLSSDASSSLCVQKYLYQTLYPSSDYLQCMYPVASNSDLSYGLGSIKADSFCQELTNI